MFSLFSVVEIRILRVIAASATVNLRKYLQDKPHIFKKRAAKTPENLLTFHTPVLTLQIGLKSGGSSAREDRPNQSAIRDDE